MVRKTISQFLEMAGKRQATSDLNHDNWDRDEEPEERGTFRTATDEELKNRIIKKAKRKITPDTGNDDGSGTKSIFSGFSGFGKQASANATSTTSSPFSFLSKTPLVTAAATGNVSSSTPTSSPVATFSFTCNTAVAPGTTKIMEGQTISFGSSEALVQSPVAKKSTAAGECVGLSEYYKKLSCLNQAVSEWIKTHVNKNPICILSPIFKDYEKHLAEIEKEKDKGEAADETKMSSATDMGSFKFSISNAALTSNKLMPYEIVTKTNGFSFDLKKPAETSSVNPSTSKGFSFGLTSSTAMSTSTTTSPSCSFGNVSNSPYHKSPSKPFSIGPGGTPFSFGNIKPPEVSGTATAGGGPTEEEEEEEAPKNEFKQVVEDDAVYSKKCKVFVKKDGSFVDKGVGTLYLKPVESSNRTQLLVRADTNLGNILVNLILNSTIPAQRMGKNNVMMVCIPTPDVEKPTSILLRVKTSEEADELLENIDKYKK